MSSSRLLRFTAAALLLGAPLAQAQVVLGVDNTLGAWFEFTTTPGGPCFAPVPSFTSCAYGPPTCPGVAPLVPSGFGTLLGDIADDPITDITYVTDGRVVAEFLGDPACAGPCLPIADWFIPIPPGFGSITGMGCSGTGSFAAVPVLWMTDGISLMGVAPPGGCGTATVIVPPCPLPTPLVPATDVSWDPSTSSLWVVGAGGAMQAVGVPGCAPSSPLVTVSACGLGLPLTGIAYDTATPNFSGQPASAWVTDGSVVAYVDTTTGTPAPPTFATPVSCTPTPGFLSGLAVAQRGVQYGGPRVLSTLSSYGQATTPGPTFGLEVTGAPAGAIPWLVVNYNFPGPGFFCPAMPGAGTKIWVDPTPPGSVGPLVSLPPGCVSLPSAIPSAVPAGLEIYVQLVFLSGTPPAVDATGGLAVTIGLP